MSTLEEALMSALAEQFQFPWYIQDSNINFRPSFDSPGPVGVLNVDETDDGLVIDIRFIFFKEDGKVLILFDTATHSALEIIQKIQTEQLVYGALNATKDSSTGQEGWAVSLRRASQLLNDDVEEDGLSEEAIDRLILDLGFLLHEADWVFAEIGAYVSGQADSNEAFSLLHVPTLGSA